MGGDGGSGRASDSECQPAGARRAAGVGDGGARRAQPGAACGRGLAAHDGGRPGDHLRHGCPPSERGVQTARAGRVPGCRRAGRGHLPRPGRARDGHGDAGPQPRPPHPSPLPAHLQQARRWTLGPVAVRSLAMEHPPEWPALAVPSEDLPPGTRLRCTVLVPAHDEEAVLGATLARWPTRPVARTGSSSSPTTAPTRPSRWPGAAASRWSRPSATPRRRPARSTSSSRLLPARERRPGRRHGHGRRLHDRPGLPRGRARRCSKRTRT